MFSDTTSRNLTKAVSAILIIVGAFFVYYYFSNVFAVSLFDPLGPINFVESFGFVCTMLIMLLFVSEIVMVFIEKATVLSKCDFLEKLTIRLSLGFALVALVPEITFSGASFFAQIAWATTITGIIIFCFRNRRRIPKLFVDSSRQIKQIKKIFGPKNKIKIFGFIPLVAVLFLSAIFLAQASTIVNGYFGSTNFDASYHTLIIRSYLDMNRVVDQPQPYYSFIIRYPRAPYTLGAYTATILSVPIHKVVVFLTLLFFTLNLLALYTLGKTIFRNQFMGLLVLILGLSSQNLWSPISWGGLPFSAGLFSTLVGLTLVIRFVEDANRFKDVGLLGLSLFLSIFTYPTAPFFVFLWCFFCLTAALIRWFYLRKKAELHYQARRLAVFSFGAVALALGLSSTYILTLVRELYSWLNNPMQGSFPELVSAQPEYLREVQWITDRVHQINPLNPVDIYSFSLLYGALLFFASVIPFVVVILWFAEKSKEVDNNHSRVFPVYLTAGLFYLLFIFAILYLRDLSSMRFILGYPFNDLIPPARVFQSFFLLLAILSAFSIYALATTLVTSIRVLFRKRHEVDQKLTFLRRVGLLLHTPEFRRGTYAFLFAVSLILYLGTSTAFYFETITTGIPQLVAGSRNSFVYFSRLSATDLELMEWMKANMEGNERVFVNWQDGGQYVSAVTHIRAVYVLSPLYESTRYQELVLSLSRDPANLPTIEFLLQNYNVTHLFVGSNGSEPRWDPYRIADSPYFELVERYGESFLFAIRLRLESHNSYGITT